MQKEEPIGCVQPDGQKAEGDAVWVGLGVREAVCVPVGVREGV